MIIMEDLKGKFIVSEEIDEKRIRELVERSLPFFRVSKSGEVIIDKSELSSLEKVKASLVARFLAHKLDSGISPEVNAEELSGYLMIPKNQVAARLKELGDEKFAFRVRRGIYSVNPSRIEDFLNDLENEYGAGK